MRSSDISISYFLTVFTIIFSSCVHGPSLDDQSTSFLQFKNIRIQGETPENYLSARTALVMNGNEAIESNIIFKKGSWNIDHGNAQSTGVACAISHDGYFLSAAHVLEKNNSEIIYLAQDTPQPVKIRIIEKIESHDLVLFHADIDTRFYFPLAKDNNRSGLKLISGGLSINTFSGGKLIVSRSDRTESTEKQKISVHILKTDLPLRKGDSGGPLIDLNGYLRGINSLVPMFYRMQKEPVSYHFIPSTRWISDRIYTDRNRKKANQN